MSFHPETPQSPSHFSPHSTDATTVVNPSTNSSFTTTLPTPAHSVNGCPMAPDVSQDIMMMDKSPKKRKRPSDDQGGRDAKKIQVEGVRGGISDLHVDVGEKYLLLRTPHSPPKALLSADIFEMFGLTGIAADVARVLPNGEKNAMRKTYKGHIKKHGISGHFDSVKSDPFSRDGFLAMMNCPEEEWQVHFVRGQEVESGLSRETRSKLKPAMSLTKGVVPNDIWDSSVLGELGPRPDRTAMAPPPAPPATSIQQQPRGSATPNPSDTHLSTTQVHDKAARRASTQDAAASRRLGKKRSFRESSAAVDPGTSGGAGENTTNADATGDSGQGMSDGDVAVKRRKKNQASRASSQLSSAAHHTSLGSGMVGV